MIDWLFLVTCSTGENTLIPNRLLRLTQAILLPAAVMLLGCNSNNDKSVDPEQVLEQSRVTLKEVDSELERIKSETEQATLAYELEANAKQPNTIYSKTEENGFTLEYLVSVEAKEEPKPDPDQDELSAEQSNTKETHVVVSLPEKIRVSKLNEEGLPTYFAFRCAQKYLDRELNRFTGSEVVYGGDLAKWKRYVEGPNGIMDGVGKENPYDDRKLAILACKAELRTSDEPFDELTPFKEPGDFNRFFNTPEIKAFVATLRYGESGEFGGWHYLKVDRTVPEDSGTEE